MVFTDTNHERIRNVVERFVLSLYA
jgi:hypothetical protein